MKTQTTKKEATYGGFWGTISNINYMNGTADFSRFNTWTPEALKLSDLKLL